MKKGSWISALAILALVPAVSSAATPVTDFALLDHKGTFHQLGRYADQKAVVVFVQGNSCPIVRLAVPTLRTIRDKYADKGVHVVMLNANVQDDLNSIRKEVADFGIDFPVLKDETQLVAEALGVVRTGEVYVLDPSKKEIVYRGPIDDRIGYETQKDVAEKHYLDDAIGALLAGKPINTNVPEAKGCLIAFPTKNADKERKISYNKEIVPMLAERCVDCHTKGGIAPFALDNHKSLQGWAPMMVETILTKRMPPGQVDMEHGLWRDDVHRILPEEMITFTHWVNQGCPKDGDSDALAAIEPKDEHAWVFGEPDYVIELPPYHVPATGVLPQPSVTVPLNLTEDRFVQAYQFNIGEREVCHHITSSMVVLNDGAAPPRRSRRPVQDIGEGAQAIDADDPEAADPRGARSAGFAGYAPGKPVASYPEGVGFRVTPGMAFRASLHYTTNGKEMTDYSRIGLWFFPKDKPPAREIRRWSAGTNRFLIPPNEHEYPVSGEATVKIDTIMYNMQPHMHYRGKHVRYTAHYPDGRIETLLNVPNYSYLWQMIYTPKEPILLPAGTKIVVSGAFDNSAMNPHNPAPEEEVKPGAQTWEEMFIGHMQVGPANPDENSVQYTRVRGD